MNKTHDARPKEASNPFDAMDKRHAQKVLVPEELHAAACPWRFADLMLLSKQVTVGLLTPPWVLPTLGLVYQNPK